MRQFLILLFVFVVVPGSAWASDHEKATRTLVPAIDFPKEVGWLNVSRPLEMEELRGRVVILDFWTYGCINCIHVLEDLDVLQQKYGNKLVVVGVHTPKFENEKNLDTLRRIVVRYGIDHPVMNDINSELARRYGMRAWPTQYVITPEGLVLGKVVGEGNLEVFERVINDLLAADQNGGEIAPLPVSLEKDRLASSFLAFPGKIAVSKKYVAISDTLNNRIVLTDHQGRVKRIIGGKLSGFVDGQADQARFAQPQGLAFSETILYVADTGNHAIRAIDLQSSEVSTVAGTGEVARSMDHHRPASETSLRSPWDLLFVGQRLLIAMAGNHQIWELDLAQDQIKLFSGNRREALVDGSLYEASYTQPSGLSGLGNWVYVADAESSAVRRIDLEEQQVETLVGKGLFEFGDEDGDFSEALLQHALGIAVLDENRVFIADTYNHKLKMLDLKERSVNTIVGTGEPGKGNGPADMTMLNEPGGLAVLEGRILISDTNNHRILQYDPDSGVVGEWLIIVE